MTCIVTLTHALLTLNTTCGVPAASDWALSLALRARCRSAADACVLGRPRFGAVHFVTGSSNFVTEPGCVANIVTDAVAFVTLIDGFEMA